ncbi:MAG TPA: ATP synthase F1 subunit epsilon [Firmicutes bacterium]|jgi:F-type H+-transporting ATPase subunit epsilon|nr:ATP synthase F1 subunit epsilon [Bacillota bacterium]
MKLVILTPRKKFFEGEIDLLNIVTLAGEIGILPGHYPLISVVKTGSIHMKIGDKVHFFATSGGVISVEKDRTVLLLEAIERPEDIDIKRAEEAKKRAEELLKQQSGEVDVLRAQAALSRALNRIEVYQKYRDS